MYDLACLWIWTLILTSTLSFDLFLHNNYLKYNWRRHRLRKACLGIKTENPMLVTHVSGYSPESEYSPPPPPLMGVDLVYTTVVQDLQSIRDKALHNYTRFVWPLFVCSVTSVFISFGVFINMISLLISFVNWCNSLLNNFLLYFTITDVRSGLSLAYLFCFILIQIFSLSNIGSQGPITSPPPHPTRRIPK